MQEVYCYSLSSCWLNFKAAAWDRNAKGDRFLVRGRSDRFLMRRRSDLVGGSSGLGMVRCGGINRLNPYLARDLID
ncbi:hypothetical protein VL20_2991 [Microcystis panniformis FACHB-1757]|uniref:Uncharacterized protein n=1 Tax=Microcystis panniformis FACHB-1757 TaxID=1638788 RepID=A0A0K1S1T7_9CHRO|nr:hypothetical protein VL20_2991 [Microcystis panniformis FACHB-1757]